MSACIESLELRTFLSASSLSADEATLSSAITALTALASTDTSAIRASLSGHVITKADKKLGEDWAKGVDTKYKLLLKADSTGTALINKDVVVLDAASSTKATAAGAKLKSDGVKALAAIDKDCNALHAADVSGLAKIGAAFRSDTTLQTTIATIEANGSADLATIRTDAGVVFTTDVDAIVAA